MNEVDIIRGAREILSDPNRWHQGSFRNNHGAVCLYGALGLASPAKNIKAVIYDRDAIDTAAALVTAHLPEGAASITTFNDNEDTTHADILNLLDKTLADLGGLA